MDLFKSLVVKMRGGPGGSDPLRRRRLLAALAPLNQASPGLAKRTADFVATGEPSSVLLSWQQQAGEIAPAIGLSNFWSLKVMQRSALRELFEPSTPWDAAEFRRLGDALGQTTAVAFGHGRWDRVGTERCPDWLVALLTLAARLHAKQGRPQEQPLFGLFTVARIREMLAGDNGDDGPLLDVLFHGQGYATDNCVALLPDAEDYLRAEPQRVIAAAGVLDAPGRVQLAGTAGRLGLAEPYAELLIDYATGSAKTVREAARSALQGLDTAALLDRLTTAVERGPGAQRANAAELIGFVAGEPGRSLLEDRLEREKSNKVQESIRRALANLDVSAAVAERTSPNGTSAPSEDAGNGRGCGCDAGTGLTALDGRPIQLPVAVTLPPDQPLPPSAFEPLRRAAQLYNSALEQAVRSAPKKGYHWSRFVQPVKPKNLDAYEQCVNGQQRGQAGRTNIQERLAPVSRMTQRNSQVSFDAGGVDQFFADPALGLPHLLRVITSEIHTTAFPLFAWLANPWGSRAVAAALDRLEPGYPQGQEPADLCVVARLWVAAGGLEPLRSYLQSEWRDGIEEPPVGGLNDYLLGQLDLLDEALGMRPQSGDKPLFPGAALEMLERLPQVPNRYLGTLMELATGSRKALREPARRLLATAPHIDPAIAGQLSSGQQAIRAGAADWLAARAARSEVAALHQALSKERSELARAALITALERLGEDINQYFDPAALRTEADKGLAKANLKTLAWFPLDQLPALRWRDGSELDPVVLRWWVVLANKLKQPGGNALFDLYLDRLDPDAAARLGLFLLRAWIDQDTRRPSEQQANAYAKAQAPGYLQQALKWDKAATLEKVFTQLRNLRRNEYLGSATANKGLLALTVRSPGPDMAAAVQAFLKNHGARIAQDKALLEALARNPAAAAMQLVLATANRFKAKTVQAFAQQQVEAIAEGRGWSSDQLADRTIPTAGMDPDGLLRLDCGADRLYTAALDQANQLVLKNPAGKPVKALPAARGDDEAEPVKAAKKALSAGKKELKQVLAMQTARLQEAMCLERGWRFDEWQQYLLRHPIVGRLCQRLLWLAVDGQDKVIASFRPLDDLSLSDAVDQEVDFTPDESGGPTIKLAHRTLLDDASRQAWLTHLADYEIDPLFDQLARPLLSATDRPPKATEVDDRRGWMMEAFKLRGAATKLGYLRGEAQDGGVFMDYIKRFEAAGILVVIDFTGSPLPEQNIACALLDLSFHPIRHQAYGRGRPLPLTEVPPVLLNEAWNDYHQLAQAGSGFDQDWEKKAEYW